MKFGDESLTMKYCKRLQNIYCINVTVFCTILFLIGFFPIKNRSGSVSTYQDIPSGIKDLRLQKDVLYMSHVNKTVFMVIDAMRYDFIEGIAGSLNMPFTNQLLSENKACLLKTRANPPTVTMPRIKALTTGTVPNFIDLIFNLGSNKIQEDNFIHQASKTKKIVFYGDETWIKLYPNVFNRSEGTTSFFVSDYTEVDYNVTKRVIEELSNRDWDIMVLHYLGLDHIGHLEGPKSLLVTPKLHEMDNVVQLIYRYLLEYEKKEFGSSLFVICGDHGMKDSGSHGGASLGEVLTPIITIGLNCPDYNKQELLQIDLTSTLSVLWGLPIPADNVGHIIVPLLHKYSPIQKLYVLFYNAQQLVNNFLRNGGSSDHDGCHSYYKAVDMHYKLLLNLSDITEQEVISTYENSLKSMSVYLAEQMVRYDFPVVIVSVINQFQVFLVMMLNICVIKITRKIVATVVFLCFVFMFVQCLYCHVTNTESLLCSNFFITATCSFISSINTILIIFNKFMFRDFQQFWKHLNFETLFLLLGQSLFLLSLTSSSLIEEEHQVWYFLWTTSCLLFIVQSKTFLKFFFMACAHVVLRRLNQTGDKWAHLPDIGDWLSHSEQSSFITILVILGLVFIYRCSWFTSRPKNSIWLRLTINILTIALLSSVYLYKVATTNNMYLLSYPKSRGHFEINLFWTFFWILLIAKLISIKWNVLKKNDKSSEELRQCICSIFIESWMLICSLLLRSYNILLLPALHAFSFVLGHQSKQNKTFAVQSTLLHHWLGMVFFFYQGNSNSLSSIDVATGYAGLSDYNIYQVSFFLIIHTYAAPVLAFLLNLHSVVSVNNENWREEVTKCLTTITLQQMLHIVVYHCFIISQCYHLFVWTVFSPKLLYLASQTLLYMILVNGTQLLCFLK